MFDFFKKQKTGGQPDAKMLRELFLQLIREQLQQFDGGEGRHISGLELAVTAAAEERHLYAAALYTGEPGKFKQEVQRTADNYAVDLPEHWELEITWPEVLPEGALQRPGLKAGLLIRMVQAGTQPAAATGSGRVSLIVRKGTAAQEFYTFSTETGRINLGREAGVQTADGSYRINQVAFPAAAAEGNKYISRQHAHLEWDPLTGTVRLFADEGGVPPGNKTKVKPVQQDTLLRLNSTGIGYPLAAGDQIMLGDTVILEVQYG